MDKELINRQYYTDKISPFIGKNIIKVITGQRRVGKGFLLLQIIEEIKSTRDNYNIISINKENIEFSEIKTEADLINYVDKKYLKDKENYLFIDEIQEITEFEIALRHYQSKGIIDIYCTGSNAKMLSGDLATYLSGRYIEFKLYSLSYLEFIKFHNLQQNSESLQKYLRIGGLPFLKNLRDSQDVINDYLTSIFSTIIYKDIISRYNIRNATILEDLVRYLASNIGNVISAKKISDYLKSQNSNTSPQVILNYLSYLKNAFLVFQVKRSDITGKKIFELKDKFYFEDWGLSNAIVGSNYFDIGKTIENVVYIHLLMGGYEVTIGQYDNKEIDFIAEKQGKKIYVQACYLIATEQVKNREFGNLLLIKDNFPKYVVSLDEYRYDNYEGIRHVHLLEFLSTIMNIY